MSMWIIQALRWARLPTQAWLPGLQKAVQTIKRKTGLQTHADNQWARIVMNQETSIASVRTLDWQMRRYWKSAAKNGKTLASAAIYQ